MEYKPLTYFCNINMGQSPDSNTYNNGSNGLPFYQGNADFGEVHPNTRVWCSKPIKIANKNDVLISVRAPIGALNIADNECCIGRGLASLTPNIELTTTNYLLYALKSKVNELNQKGTGSTFKAISKKILEETTLPFYSIDQQQKIVSILDQINHLISLRSQQLEQLDLLIKSRFIEMFGDPITNPLNWTKRKLSEECEIITGNTPSRQKSEYYGNYIEWIKSDNINTPNCFLTTATEYLSEEGLKVGRSVEAGAILMTCIAGSINCIGNVAIANRKVAFNQQINGIVPLKNSTWFMYVLFDLTRKKLQSSINMCLKGILSKGQLSEMEFIFPPLPLQTQFAAFVEEVEKEKATVKQSLEWLNTLKAKLMQEYFG